MSKTETNYDNSVIKRAIELNAKTQSDKLDAHYMDDMTPDSAQMNGLDTLHRIARRSIGPGFDDSAEAEDVIVRCMLYEVEQYGDH